MPVLARGYKPESLAQYQAGQRYQRARHWRLAVLAYDAALAADPSLLAVYKNLGAVYYEMGDRKGALYYYDRYLASYPGDSATRTVAGSLRVADEVTLPSAPVSVTAEVSPRSGIFNSGFDVRGSAMGIMASGADVAEFYGWYSQVLCAGTAAGSWDHERDLGLLPKIYV
jgi:tetratricopeptide (TPR) repeat protein